MNGMQGEQPLPRTNKTTNTTATPGFAIEIKDDTDLGSAMLIVLPPACGTAGPFVDSHDANIRTSPQGPFGAHHGEVRACVRAGASGVYIHYSKLEFSERTGYFPTGVGWNLFAGDGIDSNLSEWRWRINGSTFRILHPNPFK